MTREPLPRWLLAILFALAVLSLLPFAPWVVLALWLGLLGERIHKPLTRWLRGRSSLAATLTVLLMLLIVVPLCVVVASLVYDAVALVQRLLETKEGQSMFEQLAGGSSDTSQPETDTMSVQGITDLLMSQGGQAWSIVRRVGGAVAHVGIGLLILVSGIFGVLVEGKAWYEWAEEHAPFSPKNLKRFADAFVETGRGMAWGVVGSGLIQSIVATVTYLILGVPSAIALGTLTLMFSVIPAIGTAIVWAPVAAGLALTGRTGAAIALAAVGIGVISMVDNLARPYLAKRGNLKLPTYVVLVSMFGGIQLIGGWGLVLGPLVVRLAKEAILIRSEAMATPPPA
ncbi:MAG: AI-2E family transporter [Deltaproteobacteria bacterium]|nr:AI-2E family transporter [Deltaproteobacteria bacterium]